MTLQEFAEKHRLKIRKDSCDDLIIPGKVVKGCQGKVKRPEDACHVYEVDGKLHLYLNFPTPGRYNSARKQLLEKGAVLGLTGKMDGFLKFDPENAELVKLILKLGRFRTKRVLTEEQKTVIRERFKKTCLSF